ncbi:patatin-like phospholipase family protein [Vibrio rotiferianus]|uniref:patatin-like phospholipase family protein n=1 Tax=Vibrio rotiferianus TaxID=190895 RepID=UPI002895A1D2|nr:putative PNPLA domain-containing protein [Vibrio rotiferianus]CAH1591020.1 putative PNPLA domain-containing protein [Vibrio rotiferianus]
MEAYAVFEGGGVKGAALAGALAAAKENKIKFVGYGGASAGSIVAFLATIGYTPEEMLNALLKYQLTDYLEDESGYKLTQPKSWIDGLMRSKAKMGFMLFSPLTYLLSSRSLRETAYTIWGSIGKNGLYSTCNLEKILWKLFIDKYPTFGVMKERRITFRDLYQMTNIELKVIASDVQSGQAVIFGYDEEETADCCVISAVCASSTYPLVFEPNTTLQENKLLVDGGLSCNLPTFIFNNKNHKKLPLYAFDLYKDNENQIKTNCQKNILEFGWSLITTSLDASNAILSSLIDAIPVKVRVPNSVETLDFELQKAAIIEMYETGKHSARESFQNDPLTSKALYAADDPTMLARALYGSDLYLHVLSSILHVSTIYQMGIELRSWLYTSVTNDDSQVVAFCWKGTANSKGFHNQYVFDKMSDSDTYECWRTKLPVITSEHNETRLCLPIFDNHYIYVAGDSNEVSLPENRRPIPQKMVGVLVLEMNQSKDFCFWLNERGDAVSDQFGNVISSWLSIISKLMVSKETQYDYTN